MLRLMLDACLQALDTTPLQVLALLAATDHNSIPSLTLTLQHLLGCDLSRLCAQAGHTVRNAHLCSCGLHRPDPCCSTDGGSSGV